MKLILKNSSIDFQKSILIEKSKSFNVTAGQAMNVAMSEIVLDDFQKIGTKFRIKVDCPNGTFANNSVNLYFNQTVSKGEITTNHGFQEFTSSEVVNSICIQRPPSGVSASNEVTLTVEFYDNDFRFVKTLLNQSFTVNSGQTINEQYNLSDTVLTGNYIKLDVSGTNYASATYYGVDGNGVEQNLKAGFDTGILYVLASIDIQKLKIIRETAVSGNKERNVVVQLVK